MAGLVAMTGGAVGREFPLAEGLNRVGRAPGNEIRLEEAAISAVHCELWLMKERLLLRDLDSTNGTFLLGRPVSEAELHDGDLVTVGSVVLQVIGAPGRVAIPAPLPPPPPPPRFTADGVPCCLNHTAVPAGYRCPRCGEQFCEDCVHLLGRRGGTRHAFCPQCSVECVVIVPPRHAAGRLQTAPGWLAKLTQTLRLRR